MLCWISETAELVTYKFGYNYGQVFHDYSLNYHSAVNGISSAVDSADIVATDRGAFFAGGSNQITLPANDQVSTAFSLPGIFTIVLWIFPEASGSTVFTRYLSASSYIYMRIDSPNNKFIARIILNNQDSGENSFIYPDCMI